MPLKSYRGVCGYPGLRVVMIFCIDKEVCGEYND